MRQARHWFLVLLMIVVLAAKGTIAGEEPLRVGVLKFGTVNWELDVVKRHGFDRDAGIALEVVGLANKNATAVALLAGDVDLIVSDWIWVNRQRLSGAGYTFLPYSTALGALMVPAGSPIKQLGDLEGKRLGIAGGALDKSWLLLQALVQQETGNELKGSLEPVFAAPPLLSEQLRAGRVEAVLTFWPYAARLAAEGYHPLIEVKDILARLGVDASVPLVGYVFDEAWASEHELALKGFLAASRRAKNLLLTDDAEWEALRSLMKVRDEQSFELLRAGYRAGIPRHWGKAERAGARQLFDILAQYGGEALVGTPAEFDPESLASGFDY